mgnify:CR=1 FL=1
MSIENTIIDSKNAKDEKKTVTSVKSDLQNRQQENQHQFSHFCPFYFSEKRHFSFNIIFSPLKKGRFSPPLYITTS